MKLFIIDIISDETLVHILIRDISMMLSVSGTSRLYKTFPAGRSKGHVILISLMNREA